MELFFVILFNKSLEVIELIRIFALPKQFIINHFKSFSV